MDQVVEGTGIDAAKRITGPDQVSGEVAKSLITLFEWVSRPLRGSRIEEANVGDRFARTRIGLTLLQC